MTLQLFYTPDISPHDKVYVLNEEESKHAIRVLRLAEGHAVYLVDGKGGQYRGIITHAHPKRTAITIEDFKPDYEKRNYYLHIAVAPTKNIDRIEWFLEKATEVGIDEITPIICEHSERKEVKPERLNKVMVAAMKQSLKAYLPKLNETVKLTDFLKKDGEPQKFIAHCADGEKRYLTDGIKVAGRYVILIGPEGDFSVPEIRLAVEAGYMPITLGSSRLRTETAALVACLEAAIGNR